MMTLNDKKNFLTRTFSRRLEEMCPGVFQLKYDLEYDGREVASIICEDGTRRRVDVTGPDLQESVNAILAVLNGEVA